MAVKTMAEKIYTAYLTGSEAEFFDSGTTYEFTPDGLKDFISGGSGPTVSSVNGQTGQVVITAPDLNAVETIRTITSGTGLTGGGDLSANRTISLSASSIASLALADTAVQPSALGPQLPDTNGVTEGWVPKIQADGTFAYAADLNTTYSVGTSAEMTTGTSTTGRLINATTFPSVLASALSRVSSISALTLIADPANATTEEVANAVNSIITALKG